MKKNVKWALIAGGVVIAGIGVGWASGSPNGIHVSEGAKYQYQLINPDDIIIEYSGLKPDSKLSSYKGKYVTDTAMYLSDEVGIYLGDEHFKAKVGEYVKYSDINWTWDLSDFEMYQLMNSQGEASPSLFKGTVEYADGTEGGIQADAVDLERSKDGNNIVVSISFRGDEFIYNIPILELWDDMDSLSVEEQDAVKSESSSEVVSSNSSDTADGYIVYSEKDAPGLSSIDWDIVNSIGVNRSMDIDPSVNIFEALGKDPRINGDWSELNKVYTTYYGNDKNDTTRFLNLLCESYLQSGNFVRGYSDYAFLLFEPYRSKTDNGDYGDDIVNLENVVREESVDEYQAALREAHPIVINSIKGYVSQQGYDEISSDAQWKVPYWDTFINAVKSYGDEWAKNINTVCIEDIVREGVYNDMVNDGYIEDSAEMREALDLN